MYRILISTGCMAAQRLSSLICVMKLIHWEKSASKVKLVSDLAWGSMLHLTELVSPGWSPDVMCGMSQSVCVALRGRKHRVRTQLPPTDRMVMLLHISNHIGNDNLRFQFSIFWWINSSSFTTVCFALLGLWARVMKQRKLVAAVQRKYYWAVVLREW